MRHLVLAGLLQSLLLTGCGSDSVAGSWCDKTVSQPAECKNTKGGNDEWFAELAQADEAVTGKLCEDGFSSSDCFPLNGKLDGDTLRFTLQTKDGSRSLTFAHDGDTLDGKLGGCSTCDGTPCMCDLPIKLLRIAE